MKNYNQNEIENAFCRSKEIDVLTEQIHVMLVGSLDDYRIEDFDSKTRRIIDMLCVISELSHDNEGFLNTLQGK